MSVQVLVGLAAASSNGVMALRAAVQRQTVIGLLRDLRGITQATSSKRTYSETRPQLLRDMLSPSKCLTSAQHPNTCALACPAACTTSTVREKFQIEGCLCAQPSCLSGCTQRTYPRCGPR